MKPGDIIENKYRIVRLLGEGGMGAVFEGENTRIKRRVAIKVLHGSVASDEGAVMRFQREAQAAGHIGNEHIIEVLDLGVLENGDQFMVMEYLDGEPLSDRIKRMGRLSPEQALPIFRQILEGLTAAHGAGILHRDLKPDNIFLVSEKAGQQDYVKIIDFGISKFAPLSDEMKMTRTGTIMGTPYYMSPEQASGAKAVNEQSDIYAVGVILYEALTGAVPFDAPTFNQLMFQIVLSEPAPIEALAPDINPAFASVVKKAMARKQEYRFKSCDEFIGALDNWSSAGTAVSVPPIEAGTDLVPGAATAVAGTPDAARSSVELAATGLAQHSPLAATGGGLAHTNQSWATAGHTPKSRTPWVLAGAAVGVLALGGAGFAFMGGGGEPGSPVDTEGAGPVPVAAAAQPRAAETQATTVDEASAAAEAEGADLIEAEPAKQAAAEQEAALEAEPTEAEADETAPEEQAEAASPPKQVGAVPRKSTPRRLASPKPKKKPAAKRRDFGY